MQAPNVAPDSLFRRVLRRWVGDRSAASAAPDLQISATTLASYLRGAAAPSGTGMRRLAQRMGLAEAYAALALLVHYDDDLLVALADARSALGRRGATPPTSDALEQAEARLSLALEQIEVWRADA